MVIRQEINIIDASEGYTTGPVTISRAKVQIDTTQYVNPTYYFEAVLKISSSGSISTSSAISLLNSSGSSVCDLKQVKDLTASFVRYRSSFTPTTGQDTYNISGNSDGSRTVTVQAARIIVIDNPTTLTSTETQIEVGDNETTLIGTSSTNGGHRFFSKSKEVEDFWTEILADELLDRPRSSRIFYNKKFFSYPLAAFEALMKLGIWESFLL